MANLEYAQGKDGNYGVYLRMGYAYCPSRAARSCPHRDPAVYFGSISDEQFTPTSYAATNRFIPARPREVLAFSRKPFASSTVSPGEAMIQTQHPEIALSEAG